MNTLNKVAQLVAHKRAKQQNITKVANLLRAAKNQKMVKEAGFLKWLKTGLGAIPAGQTPGWKRKLSAPFRINTDPSKAMSWKRLTAAGATIPTWQGGKWVANKLTSGNTKDKNTTAKPEQKSWWEANKNWALPTGVAAGTLALILSLLKR